MALEIIKNINVDFYDKEYIMINAKQYDDRSRWIAVTCCNQGEPLNFNAREHSAYVKCRKADGYSVFNLCKINQKGEVLVELTEQMLAAVGICYVDLLIVNKGNAIVDISTGEITVIDDIPILSTMAFCINVYESSIDNSEIESADDFSALNELMQKVEADYSEVSELAKSYAIGGTGLRANEDSDNSKYYSERAQGVVNTVLVSENNALNYSNVSKSYAVGETGTRGNESVDNAKYYLEVIRGIVSGINNGFLPMGTIAFEDLASVVKDVGYTYNISNDFVTDNTFREGAGKQFTAGTNVYYCSDGYWDCLGGSSVVIDNLTASVDEVKTYLNI